MIKFESNGSFAKTESFLKRMSTSEIFRSLNRYGELGRSALARATPQDGGETAASWSYRVAKRGTKWEIVWTNSNRPGGVPLAIMLQYGHGTGTGGFVQGRDYINPAIQPVFDQIAKAVWEEVTRA